MATQWYLVSPTWFCSVEIQETRWKMMYGFLISKEDLSVGLNINFKTAECPVPESITQRPYASKAKQQAWWWFLEVDEKIRRITMGHKEIWISRLWMMFGVWWSIGMVYGIGILLLALTTMCRSADISIWCVLLGANLLLWEGGQIIQRNP